MVSMADWFETPLNGSSRPETWLSIFDQSAKAKTDVVFFGGFDALLRGKNMNTNMTVMQCNFPCATLLLALGVFT